MSVLRKDGRRSDQGEEYKANKLKTGIAKPKDIEGRKRAREVSSDLSENAKAKSLKKSSPDESVRMNRTKELRKTSSNEITKGSSSRTKVSGTGVIYLGHLPQGFFEPQIKSFFSQFGRVTRLIVPRSKKNGHVKGYAYVEFELKEVARIAAEAMDSYRVFGKSLVCKFLSSDEVLARGNLFRNCNKKFNSRLGHIQFMKIHNKDDDSVSSKQAKSQISKCQKVANLIKNMDADAEYDVTSLFTAKNVEKKAGISESESIDDTVKISSSSQQKTKRKIVKK